MSLKNLEEIAGGVGTLTRLYLNLDGSGRGGPHVWAGRFKRELEQRGFSVTHRLSHDWSSALFINQTSNLDRALERDQVVGYRVAMGFLAPWFEKLGRRMHLEHHAANAGIAHALERASVVFYQSEWARAQLDAHFYQRSGPSAVILNGVDLTEFKPPPSRPQGPPVIGTVGLLRYRFRLATFFELSRRLPVPHRLLVVGEMDDECAEELRAARADPLIKDRLIYRPFVPPENLPSIYAQMSLLIHPVSGDICPNVVAEALACGVPLVAPRFGGTVELVGVAKAGEEAGFTITSTLRIVPDTDIPTKAITVTIKSGAVKGDDNMIQLEPLGISWDRDGGKVSGDVVTLGTVSLLTPSKRFIGLPTLFEITVFITPTDEVIID